MMASINDLRAIYCQADRCWRANSHKSCLQLCDQLSRSIKNKISNDPISDLSQLTNLVWFLKIKCLAEDHFVDESLLLNEDDVESDDQVHTITTSTKQLRSRPVTALTSRAVGESDKRKSGGVRINSSKGQRTSGMMTGRMPTRSGSRQTGRATSSYRPLTTSLTATQTAFSRSTKPLLRYSTDCHMSKPIYEYLYNVQKVNNKCPDYRQCLEYLIMIPKSDDKKKSKMEQQQIGGDPSEDQLITLADEVSSVNCTSSPYWCLSYALCYYNLKMHKLAAEYLRAALKVSPKYLDAYLWLIKVYLRFNQPLKVLKICDEGLQNIRSSILYNWKARVQSLLDQKHAAHLSLRESIKFYPTNIEALANVGYYSFYGDKLELALKCFERIYQLSSGSFGNMGTLSSSCSEAELFNNLALVNFQCGNYHKALPLFQRALLCSSSKEVTSSIWYNMSFVPLNLGSRPLAMACLKMALKNDSQNEDALNNFGVLKYDNLINDPLHYCNRQETWSGATSKSSKSSSESSDLRNRTDQRRFQTLFDDAETFFCKPRPDTLHESDDESYGPSLTAGTPVMVYNMAVLKRKRGQLMASALYCRIYLETDPNNYTIKGILSEICDLVSHDS